MKGTDLLQLVPLLASVVMALATIAALWWGIWTYRRNAEAQILLLALQTLQHHLDLALAHPDLASRESDTPFAARDAWFAAHALTTAQTLWTLVGTRPEWQRSIRAIVRANEVYLRSGLFTCEDFAPEFIAHLRSLVPGLRCAPSAATATA